MLLNMAQMIQASTTRFRIFFKPHTEYYCYYYYFHTNRPSVLTKPVNPLIDPLEIRVKKYAAFFLELTGSRSEINPFWWFGSEYGTLWACHCVWVAKIP